MPGSPDLTSARMSYAAAIVACVAYGMYFVLSGICIHFLLKRRSRGRSHVVILVYTVLMLIVSTIYFVSGCIWSEIEFVESTADIGVFDTLLTSPLALLKDTAYVVNIGLADSLLIYRMFVVWRGFPAVIVLPCCLWTGTMVTGICLVVSSAKASLTAWNVIHYQTAFYSLTVSHNIICTLLIAGRMWYHQHSMRKLRANKGWTHSAFVAITIESAALYSICGIIYIPLVVKMLPGQFPVSALIGGLTSIAPNLIILRVALGAAMSTESSAPGGMMLKLSSMRSGQESGDVDQLGSGRAGVFNGSRSTIPSPKAAEVWQTDYKVGTERAVLQGEESV